MKSVLGEYACWMCPNRFNSQRDLKNHVSSKVHKRIKVICAWCYGEERCFRGSSELKIHVKGHHRQDSKDLPDRLLGEPNCFWFSLLPDEYRRVIQPTTWNSPLAVLARRLVEEWVRRSIRPSKSIEEWRLGWNKERRPTSQEYHPESPEIEAISIRLIQLSSAGAYAILQSTEMVYRVTFAQSLFTNLRAMTSLSRKMTVKQDQLFLEPPGHWEELSGITLQEKKILASRSLDIDVGLISELVSKQSETVLRSAKRQRTDTPTDADIGDDPNISPDFDLVQADRRLVQSSSPTIASVEAMTPVTTFSVMPTATNGMSTIATSATASGLETLTSTFTTSMPVIYSASPSLTLPFKPLTVASSLSMLTSTSDILKSTAVSSSVTESAFNSMSSPNESVYAPMLTSSSDVPKFITTVSSITLSVTSSISAPVLTSFPDVSTTTASSITESAFCSVLPSANVIAVQTPLHATSITHSPLQVPSPSPADIAPSIVVPSVSFKPLFTSSSSQSISSSPCPASPTADLNDQSLIGPSSRRARVLLAKGCMPVYPPALRSWDEDEVVLLPNGMNWPPRHWKSFTPDQKLMHWEFVSMSLEQHFNKATTVTSNRADLLHKYNMLALPGTKLPRMTNKDLEMSRFYNFRVLSAIAKGNSDSTTEQFLQLMECLPNLDKFVQSIIAEIENKNVSLRI